MRESVKGIRLLAEALTFLGTWGFLKFVAQWSYDHFLPGVPDTGRWPVASLVWLLLQDFVPGRVWSDFSHAAVWLPSLAMLVFPTWIVTALATSRGSRRLAWGLSASLIFWEAVATYEMQSDYVRVFRSPEKPMEIMWWIVEPILWVIGACAAGMLLGFSFRRKTVSNELAMTTPNAQAAPN